MLLKQNKKLLFLLSLICCLALAGVVNAQDQNYYTNADIQNINPNGISMLFPTYNTTTVTLTYATSINYSLSVSSPSTEHYETSSPTGITFTAEGIDTYMLHFQVLYMTQINQSIALTVQSGNGQIINIPLNIANSGFTLDIIITTSNQPQFPSPADLWNYGNAQQAALITSMYTNFANLVRWSTTVLWIVVGAVFIIGLLIYLILRHQRFTDQRINNLNNRGLGEY